MTKEEFEKYQNKIESYKVLQKEIEKLEDDKSIINDYFNGAAYTIYNDKHVYLDPDIGEKVHDYTLKLIEDKIKLLEMQQSDI